MHRDEQSEDVAEIPRYRTRPFRKRRERRHEEGEGGAIFEVIQVLARVQCIEIAPGEEIEKRCAENAQVIRFATPVLVERCSDRDSGINGSDKAPIKRKRLRT